uniref:Uncharacterized protein LOC100372741 n=1 Tax=Saccoglossus kowalevskii TaxID=10224 RepID=A0ABM0MUH3_SACKO|nr:PREDICTED: uncharacterized protein LOC100372741 [Saccoglossus kowalevskii]
MEKLIESGSKLGLEGKNLLDFVTQQQNIEREERQREREFKRVEIERGLEEKKKAMQLEADRKRQQAEFEENEAQRKHELEMKQLELKGALSRSPDSRYTDLAKSPKLPAFVDGKDELDSYLLRFERFAASNEWDKSKWATSLSALLTGKALDVYSRLSDMAASDYGLVKEALLKRYELTEEGYRLRFMNFKPENGDVSIRMREKQPRTLDELAKYADRYLIAHDRKLTSPCDFPCIKSQMPGGQEINSDVQCYKCKEYGHMSRECKVRPSQGYGVRCYNCGRLGHRSVTCRFSTRFGDRPNVRKVGAAVVDLGGDAEQEGEISAVCLVQPKFTTKADIESCIDGGELLLAGGKRIPLVHNACFQQSVKSKTKMPVVKGRIGEKVVTTLRDTGCSGVVVKRDFVSDNQYTGKFCCMLMIDNTARTVPIAKLYVDTPYFTGEVEAQCLPDAIYDLVIGNVEGARAPDDPDPQWQEMCAVATRAMAKKGNKIVPLCVPDGGKSLDVSKAQLVKLQHDDPSLSKYWSLKEPKFKGNQEVMFLEKGGILYRQFTHPHVNQGRPVKQMVVPMPLRNQVMMVAHDSITGGHMGVKKTSDRVLSNFYWPGIHGDITRFCRSCDICQRTVPKRKIAKVPLQKMPLIDVPFKRVAIDLVGPIHPPSEKGHKYILTLVDYATRYPEAIPLKHISTEDVAEALVDMYSRLGIPEEILHDMGTQFVSECMCEVSRLLSIRQLSTTPYHPMCNGLVEKFNGTLKAMLKRLCSEQPKQWHRYINALLFAYREVPQESTGFAPFELMYGRTIRGPMHILKQLWTTETEEPEIRNSYQYVFELRERLDETLKIAQVEMQKSQQRYKHYYDRKVKVRRFQPGQTVLILLPTDSNKLLMQWKGPYEIDSVIGVNDYRVKVRGQYKTYHANLLTKYIQRNEQSSEAADNLPVLGIASAAVIEYEESLDEDAVQDDDLLVLNSCMSKESVADVKYGRNLTHDQEQSVRCLVHEYKHIFTDLPGTTNLIQHRIQLRTDEPIRSRPYPVPYSVRESLKEDIQSMLKMGVIRETESPYASPVVIVRKKDGSNRICIDYRKLNKVTVFDPEPMVTADDMFQYLSKDKYFTKVDLSKGFWQVPVAGEDIHKTAFVTPDGTYEFLKMPFGMMNSGATLVRGVRKMLSGMCKVVSYVDDILVHTITWCEHITTLKELFSRMADAQLTARPSKCIIASDVIDFVGHRVGQGFLSPHEDNVKKVRNVPRPMTKKEVRSFLGLTGFYREYIPNYAAIAVPLTDLTKNGQPIKVVWGEAQEKAYRTLIHIITSKPILRLHDSHKPYVLRTDASDIGIASVLLQGHDGKLFPVSYASKKLSQREKAYSTIEKECLAIVWSVKKYMMYLYGTQFILQTDHQPLLYVDKAKFINDKVMRWAMFLQNYRFTVECIKGSDNHGADFLSRAV